MLPGLQVELPYEKKARVQASQLNCLGSILTARVSGENSRKLRAEHNNW